MPKHITTHHTQVTTGNRAHSKQPKVSAVIRRGVLTHFEPATYTASVLLLEATNTFLQNVPIAYHMDGTSAVVNNFCAVLFFDQQNYTDALIIAIYPGAGVGSPTYLPGRLTFIPPWSFLSSVTLTSGSTNTYTVTGSHSIPSSALGVLIGGFFTSTTASSYVQIGAHGATNVLTLGNLYAASGFVNGNGIIPVDSNGRIDLKANVGDCIVTFSIYGYII
jgi:hypothetical protein